MEDKDFIINNYQNMWKMSGIGLQMLIQDIGDFTNHGALKQWLDFITTNFDEKIIYKPIKKLTIMDMFKFQLINNIIQHDGDIEMLINYTQGTLYEFFAQMKDLDEHSDEFHDEYRKFMMSF